MHPQATDHDEGNSVLSMLKRLLGSCTPVMVMAALVAVMGIGGTAYGAKLITGLDIRDGSVTALDLSKKTQASLRGAKGVAGLKGAAGVRGTIGARGTAGDTGSTGATGAASTVAGPTGPAGVNGTNGTNAVRYFAAVAANGTLSTTRLSGVAAASVTPGTGLYDVALTGAPFDASTCVALAQVTDGAGAAFAMPGATGHVAVHTYELGDAVVPDGTPTDHAFVVTVSC
jgi:hypothetical protein